MLSHGDKKGMHGGGLSDKMAIGKMANVKMAFCQMSKSI